MPDTTTNNRRSQNSGKWSLKIKVLLGVIITLIIVGLISYYIYKKVSTGSSGTTNDEIGEISKQLFADEFNQQNSTASSYLAGVNLELEPKRNDGTRLRLLSVNNAWLTKNPNSTVALMKRLFDNHELDTTAAETMTNEEEQEQLDFLKAVLKTPIMERTMEFLHKKDVAPSDHDGQLNLLKDLWFMPYSRGQGQASSTGFEHVFMAEIKLNKVLGLHNWIYFSQQEQMGHLIYEGYVKDLVLGKGNHHLVSTRFTFHGITKAHNTLFIGTSPELEMSLYTMCFLLRMDFVCKVQADDKRFAILTHGWDWNGKSTIAAAYPSIPRVDDLDAKVLVLPTDEI